MPVEIRELQINVTVNQQNGAAAASSQENAPPGGNEDKKNLINQCIEQVMDIINNKKER
jgi:hypothetical protein